MIGWRANWSPDGNKVATGYCVNCERGGGNYEIFVVEEPGKPYEEGDTRRLTDYKGYDGGLRWNPNGKRIAFASNRAHLGEEDARQLNDIYVANADGSDLRRLTERSDVKSYLWSPDGQCMAVSFDEELFLLDSENGNSERLQVGLPKKYEGVYLIDWPVSEKMILRATTNYDYFDFFLVNPRTGLTNMIEKLSKINGLTSLPDWFLPSEAR